MEERWPMKVHRVLGRWSANADLVPDWMGWAHMFLAAVFALAVTLKFDLPFWVGILTFIAGTVLLTLGLFHRWSAIAVAALGSLVAIGASTIVLGALFHFVVRRVLGDGDPGLYASLAAGAIVGGYASIASYRPFLRRLREPSGSKV